MLTIYVNCFAHQLQLTRVCTWLLQKEILILIASFFNLDVTGLLNAGFSCKCWTILLRERQIVKVNEELSKGTELHSERDLNRETCVNDLVIHLGAHIIKFDYYVFVGDWCACNHVDVGSSSQHRVETETTYHIRCTLLNL